MNELRINHLTAAVEQKTVIKDLNLIIKSGEIHTVMGPNGSGKSSLALTITGHPSYKTTPQSQIKLNSRNILPLSPENRARIGLFLAFQQPITVPGVSFINFLRFAKYSHNKTTNQTPPLKDFLWELKSCAKKLNISEGFLYRYLNENLSGGEKKKMECLQALVLKPKFAIFDEIDTGLDIDALKIVAGVINELAKNGTGVILITHYQRILKYLHSDKIHILVNGRIVKTGNSDLAFALEKTGYSVFAK